MSSVSNLFFAILTVDLHFSSSSIVDAQECLVLACIVDNIVWLYRTKCRWKQLCSSFISFTVVQILLPSRVHQQSFSRWLLKYLLIAISSRFWKLVSKKRLSSIFNPLSFHPVQLLKYFAIHLPLPPVHLKCYWSHCAKHSWHCAQDKTIVVGIRGL